MRLWSIMSPLTTRMTLGTRFHNMYELQQSDEERGPEGLQRSEQDRHNEEDLGRRRSRSRIRKAREMVILLLCGGSSGDVVHATGPYNKSPSTPPDVAKRSRRRKDRHPGGPPVSSVLVQSKGGDSVTHDTTFCRTENEDRELELESLTYGSRHEESSVSPLPPIVEHDGSSDDSLTEEDDEDLQLLLIPKAVDRNDFHHHHHGAPSTSSLMPVMELLVRTVLDDPTVPLSKSSCFDAVLKCGKDKAEIHRLLQQIRELQLEQKQEKQLPVTSTKAAPVRKGSMYYEVRDLSALRSKRNGKMEAELRLRQSILRCWSPPSSREDDDDEEEGQKAQIPNDMLESDYSCIIPVDTKRNTATGPGGRSASTPPNRNPGTRKHFPSSGSDAPTLPTAASSETSEGSVGPDAPAAALVRTAPAAKPIDELDDSAHVSVRLAL